MASRPASLLRSLALARPGARPPATAAGDTANASRIESAPVFKAAIVAAIVAVFLPAFLAAIALASATPASAIVVGQLDDFQDDTTQGWVDALGGAISPVPPVVIADSGPGGAGDFALRATTTGSFIGAGSKLVINNVEPRWQGNYLAAGVDGLMVDVRNPGPTDLFLRVAIDGPAIGATGGRWVSPAVLIPAQSGWQTATLSLAPEDLLPGDFAATEAEATLANVAVLRLLHVSTASWVGDSGAAQMSIDDIEALPEPAAGTAVLVGSLLVGTLGAQRRRN